MQYGFVTAFIYLFTGLIAPVLAQQQIFKSYTVNDGLISNSIRRVFQDSKGFLWIATWEGLSKYDGHAFTNYSTANGLSHNLVNDFYESKDGLLYVALNNGNIDIIKDNKVIRNLASPTTVVNRFINAARHQVIVTTDLKGLQEFSKGKLIKPAQTFPAYTYSDLTWLNDSLFIVAGDSTISVFNRNYELFNQVKDHYPAYVDSKIYQDSKKRIWAGTYAGLKLMAGIPPKNRPLSFTSLPAPFNIPALQQRTINDILEDRDGTMWFGTSGGLVKINPDGSHKVITVNDGLSSNIVTTIFQDTEKNIWFGTAVGLSKLVTKSGIRLYAIEDGVWSNDNSYLLYPLKKNHLLVSTNKGAKVFNQLTGNFTAVDNGVDQFFSIVASNRTPPLLIGLNKMATFDTIILQTGNALPLPLIPVSRMISDTGGNLFLSNLEHLFFRSGKINQAILDHRISGLMIDKNGYLWAATWENGLYRIQYSVKDKRITILSTDHFLPTENIRSLFEDSKGNIWIGTRYQGVYRFIQNGKRSFAVSKYDQSNGLTSNFVKGIREDANGNFWIAFYQGLDKLIPVNDSFRIFNFSRINNYFASIIGMETGEDHSLWLATGEGLVHITDGEMEKSPPLPVYITKVSSPDSIYPLNTNTIQLNHHQNQVQFEFSSPGFMNEKQVVYSYRLSGSSTREWTAAGNQHIVSYASLQPGSYLFEVRTLGWNGSWGIPASFEFIINPPFWQTWWFVSLTFPLAVFIIWALIKKRIKAIRHEAEMKQKIAETEMMALRAQMNPHFIFNCLNSIDNLIQMDEKEKATSYLSKFAKLIRSILENSKNNIVPCWKDMETLQLYLELEALRFDNKFSYQVNIAPDIMNGDYKVPPLVIQPFVENAIHHGLLNKIEPGKILLVNVSVCNNHIHYHIEDNGVGRKKAASYKQLNKPVYESMGMQITADRINLFNQQNNGCVKITDLYDENDRPLGTKVEVDLINNS